MKINTEEEHESVTKIKEDKGKKAEL